MRAFLALLLLLLPVLAWAQPTHRPTHCNPLNLDYGYTPLPEYSTGGRHRATSDPVITLFKGTYYLFSTNQKGYWWSNDLADWHFLARSFLKPKNKVPDDLCAPAVRAMGDKLFVIGSSHNSNFALWRSTDPKADKWEEVVGPFPLAGWDPDLFLDTDGKLYFYYGSSNDQPLYGAQLSRKTYQFIGSPQPLFKLNETQFGWQSFCECLDDSFLNSFMEGAWMTKHAGEYYLPYGAPGTEFSGYADGVQGADHPLGPYAPQPHNLFAWKPGGFARGAGHGNTFQDKRGNWWHASTIVVAVKNNFERLLGLWPTGYDAAGTLYMNTAFNENGISGRTPVLKAE